MSDEYTKEQIEVNGNGMYGGKRHDEICDYLQTTYGFSETEINNISMGVWKGINSERYKNQAEITKLKAEKGMMLNLIEDTVRNSGWAHHTLSEKLTFGLDEKDAFYHRERRAKVVLQDINFDSQEILKKIDG